MICGDFSAVPSEPVYDVFKHSSSTQLASAYYVAGSGQEPEFTFWKFRETGESLYTIGIPVLSWQWLAYGDCPHVRRLG